MNLDLDFTFGRLRNRRILQGRMAMASVVQNTGDARELGRPATSMSGAAAFLAYAGALPLIAAALLIVSGHPSANVAANAMAVYGALLLAFFGGVRWGVAVMKPANGKGGPSFRALLGGAIPLAAAAPLFAPMETSAKFSYAVAALVILLIDDLGATRAGSGAPGWYLAVRAPLTVLMATAYLVALVALSR